MLDNTSLETPRLRRERQTLQAMICLYCQEQHGTRQGLCPSCVDLEAYALARLAHCRYGSNKSTCVNCPTHCYKPEMRQQVRTVMRYAGPRMLMKHPLLAILHLLDGKFDKRRNLDRKSKSPNS
jgi:hypothetical protein